jgi:hypothetical protein
MTYIGKQNCKRCNKEMIVRTTNRMYCEICGKNNKLEKHHWRYDKPLLVNTLCKGCHAIQHIKKRRNLL